MKGEQGVKAIWLDDLSDSSEYGNLRRAMESAGLEVTSVASEEALHKHLATEVFDLYVLDFQLPGTSGIEVAQGLLAAYGDIPILFLSEFVPNWPVKNQIDPRARFRVLYKPIHDYSAWIRDDLGPAIVALLDSNPTWHARGPYTGDPRLQIWDYGLSVLDGMGLDRLLELEADAAEALHSLKADVFEKSPVEWFVVVGDDARIVLWGGLGDDPPGP